MTIPTTLVICPGDEESPATTLDVDYNNHCVMFIRGDERFDIHQMDLWRTIFALRHAAKLLGEE